LSIISNVKEQGAFLARHKAWRRRKPLSAFGIQHLAVPSILPRLDGNSTVTIQENSK
jgi:hypothetical protein